ncbi:hypothetical protein ALC62_10148 [Cyphomyrmex costatus]|uniref:Uncharacterized protein n=1 Tax=Cyphomyrmex costatus TaxID=456900 RepID=A0A195CE79_9HYME|nr:hypothetical protein ALC62_10148 [Cyphomyrmex costatus]
MPGNTLTLSTDDGEQAGEENDRMAPRHLFSPSFPPRGYFHPAVLQLRLHFSRPLPHACSQLYRIYLSDIDTDRFAPNSIYKLFQYVRECTSSFNVIKHFYCKNCYLTNIIDMALNILSLVKSSTSHCWPLICVIIAELSKHFSETFIIMIDLWYDEKQKPLMNTFIYMDFVQNCKIFSKIVVPLIIADVPARTQIQNIVNFNGKYDCNICKIKIKRCEKIGTEKCIRIYPFNNKNSKLRSSYTQKGNFIILTLPFIDLGTYLIPKYLVNSVYDKKHLGQEIINNLRIVQGIQIL